MEELERQAGPQSRNSSKSPTTATLAKPSVPKKAPKQKRTSSQRRLSGRRPRGQPGHPGATLFQTEHPNHIKTHRPPQCAGCGTADGERHGRLAAPAAGVRPACAAALEVTEP